jgi:nicotinamide mononucleotide transporter
MLEVIAVISTLICVYLTSKNDWLCWPVGIVGILSYFMIFRINGDISNMLLQLLFLSQSFLGWYNWRTENYNITDLSPMKRLLSGLLTLVIILILFSINVKFGGNFIYIDSITAGLSIMAIYLTSIKKIEAWIYWIVADILYLILFYQNKLYLSLILYLILLNLAFWGYKNWKKLKEDYDREFNT